MGLSLFGEARASPPRKSVVFWGPHPTRLASLDEDVIQTSFFITLLKSWPMVTDSKSVGIGFSCPAFLVPSRRAPPPRRTQTPLKRLPNKVHVAPFPPPRWSRVVERRDAPAPPRADTVRAALGAARRPRSGFSFRLRCNADMRSTTPASS